MSSANEMKRCVVLGFLIASPALWGLNVAVAATHLGGGNASAVALVDADYMVIGDDETQELRIYHRWRSGVADYVRDFSQELGLRELGAMGRFREVDIEAAAQLGSRVYWLGSHSNCSNCTPLGEIRRNRRRLFATDITGAGRQSTLHYVGRYDNLLSDLVSWDSGNLHRKGAAYYGFEQSARPGLPPEAPTLDGFNLEGLAFSADGTVAYLGFRAPLIPGSGRTLALVVPVLNLPQLVIGNPAPGPAIFGDPIELDLNGRGIRGLETFGTGLMIIAGPVASGGSFRLFSWSGRRGEPAHEHLAELSLPVPESLLFDPPQQIGGGVQVISDGSRTNASSQWVILGQPIPQVLQPTWSKANGFGATFFGRPGNDYWVEVREETGAWRTVDRITIPFSGYRTWQPDYDLLPRRTHGMVRLRTIP
ncbi:MAG: DUF3616 domain-containing protein [Verrucomicrobia bacterium]|nr:DUF3616 domain-containing protein [Verrucomicrobiota bacterium]